jgi:hypothetical protein
MSNLAELVKARDVDAIRSYMAEHNLKLDGLQIVPADAATKKSLKAQEDFWNQRQQARKILLNSLYGALLNEGLRFYDERLGQSVTLTGRSIVRHMNAKSNEVITGEYDYMGRAIVYADTDSCYFSAYEILKEDPAYADFEWTRENIISLYDNISDVVNESFPEFMQRSFNTTLERGAIIAAGRELVASSGLFIKKKKYAVLMYDKDGTRLDKGNSPGKLKAMGLDLKRADTPKYMQKFLEGLLMDVLQDGSKAVAFDQIREFRVGFKARPSWEKGAPKAVKGLSVYGDKLSKSHKVGVMSKEGKSKVNMPGHVRASLNWNTLCELNDDRYTPRITDGTRIVVCPLKSNALRMDSISYPIDVDANHLPRWFKELPFDEAAMEDKIIDFKLKNLLGVLDWNLQDTKDIPGEEFFTFEEY